MNTFSALILIVIVRSLVWCVVVTARIKKRVKQTTADIAFLRTVTMRTDGGLTLRRRGGG